MQKKEICTIENLKAYLSSNLSSKRYQHVVAVAASCEQVLSHYKCTNYEQTWNGISAGTFCGLAHDISRELPAQTWFDYCNKYGVEISKEALDFPVFLHGAVSSLMLQEMYDGIPKSWLRAVEIHTLGDKDMDDLALSLYIADYIEPNRTYLTDERRAKYLSCPTIQLCAYSILCDIIKHLESKGYPIDTQTLLMKEFLEKK